MTAVVPLPAAASPCVHCPWRPSNQGKRHPDGWYTKANLASLWARLRRGDQMSCHPTDPGNPVSERAQAAGYRSAPAGSKVRECTGALIVAQREFMILQDGMGADLRRYRRERPKGLTRDGILAMIDRFMFGGTAFGGITMTRPDLGQDDVGVPWLEWSPPSREVAP